MNAYITQSTQDADEIALLRQVFENIPLSVTITNLLGEIEWVNPTFSTMTGYSFAEVKGKRPGTILQGQSTDPAVVSYMRDCLVRQEGFEVDILNYHKDGHTFWHRLKVTPALDRLGQPRWFIGIQADLPLHYKGENQLWRNTNYDPVTGLPNDRLFRILLQQAIKMSFVRNQPFALLFIDLDRFKEVNDLYTHQAGDRLLATCAGRLTVTVSELDTVVRLGGDEFAVILTQNPSLLHVEDMAQRVRTVLAEPFEIDGDSVYLSASIGISVFPNDTDEGEKLLQNAHQAMYEAKRTGRNRVCYFTHSLQEKATFRLCMSNDLRRALATDELKLYFQPIVDLATGRIVKAEALLRWIHPMRGAIGPAEFIPVAEECGLINEVGKWLANTVFRWLKRFTEEFDLSFQVSINKSPAELGSEGADAAWPLYLKVFSLLGKSLCLEITEGLLLNSSASVIEKLQEYRNAGIQISIDDFGTGYSSMSYLQKFHVDYLKIDKSFVANMTTVAADRTIVEAIILMAHKLGLQVVAEGVETEDQKRILVAARCDFGQGYLFSQPLLAEDFEALLRRY